MIHFLHQYAEIPPNYEGAGPVSCHQGTTTWLSWSLFIIFITTRGGGGELCSIPSFPKGVSLVLWVIGGIPPLYRLFVLSVRASVRTFFGATTRQRPSYLIKTPHHHHHNTTEEEDRADNTPSPPPLAALFVVGGGGGRRREEKKKRKNILYARNAFFCMMYSISVSEPNIPI